MAYFQNPFASEFRGSWVLGDRQYSLTFVCPPNTGRSSELVVAWNEPVGTPAVYNLSGNDADGNPNSILNIRISIDSGSQTWVNLPIDLTDNTYAGISPSPSSSAIEPKDIVVILNSNPTFSSYFTATLQKGASGLLNKVAIRQKGEATRFKFFIINGQAEEVLKFNARAGVSQLPLYFAKCKVWGGDMSDPTDGSNWLVLLDPSNLGGSSSVDNLVIDNATDSKGVSLGLNSHTQKEDWELLAGRGSGLFNFKKITVDTSDRITQVIEYPTGSGVGAFAKKTQYVYTNSNKNPTYVTEIPYVLKSSDLISP